MTCYVSAVDISDLAPEKWVVDSSIEQNGIANIAIHGNVGTTYSEAKIIEAFKAGLISEIIMQDIDPSAKDAVLKCITTFKLKRNP